MTGSTPIERDDHEFVRRANTGDASAFEALYDRYRDWILRSARVVTGSDDLAADVLQEVILYWLSLFPGFVLQGKVTSFLYPCVRHTALEILRKRGRVADTRDDVRGAEGGATAVDAARGRPAGDAESRRDALRRAFDSLPLEQREVLHLAVSEGLALAEIARSLAIPVGTVKSRLHHALARLRENEALRKSLFE